MTTKTINPKSLENLRPREPLGDKPKVRINIMFDPGLLEQLDQLTGSRSSNLEKAARLLLSSQTQ